MDFGCGPGTISVGLAERIAPGELYGVDMEESQIELARAAAAEGGHDNMQFHVGNAYDLPFDDNTFDVAHCHAVLMHIPDTQKALTEVRRVLRPGGLLACREANVASSYLEPQPQEITEAWGVFSGLVQGNGGHPNFGKELKMALLDAEFSDVSVTASLDSFSSVSDVSFLHSFISEWFFSPRVVAALTGLGLATQEQIDHWKRLLDDWRENPGASGAVAFGEAIATSP